MQEQGDRDTRIEVTERLRAMRARESSYACPDYLADGWQRGPRRKSGSPGRRCGDDLDDLVVPLSPSTSSTDVSAPEGHSHDDSHPSGRISEAWREKVCLWSYQVADGYDLDREVVSVAASCLDRYLAARPADGRRFRLAGMTALYLAIKLHSNDRRLPLSCFVRMGRAFSREQFEETERDMLEALRWRVHPATPRAVCRELLRLVPPGAAVGEDLEIRETALFLAELSVCDYQFATKTPSSVALAAVVLAIDLQDGTADPRRLAGFLKQAAGGGLGDIVYSREVGECYRRLRGMYEIAA